MTIEGTFDQYPYLLAQVLSYLDARSLSVASQVNRLWQELATKNELWEPLSQAQWPDLCKKINAPPRWKNFHDRLKAFKANELQLQLTLNEHTDAIRALAILPDGNLASGSDDKTIRLWHTQAGECLKTLKRHTNWILALAILPDGTLTSGSRDKTIRLWNTRTGECLNVLNEHTNAIRTLAILPDGTLASGSDDKTIRLWHTQTGECLNTLKRHTNWILALALLPDGTLTSGSYDNTIRLWDTQTGECRNALNGHTGAIYTLAILPMGTWQVDRAIQLSGFGTRKLQIA